jgi:putative peptidoglycan lipid II flippase
MMARRTSSAAMVVSIMAALTLVSKFLGFIREVFLANYFGTSYVVDAYVMAMNIPQTIFAGILGATAITFIPVYAAILEEDGRLPADLFASRLINGIGVVSVVVSAAGIAFAPQLVGLFAYGWRTNPEMAPAIALCIFYVRIGFVALFFTAIAELQAAWQRFHHHYYVPIIVTYGQNICIIAFTIIAAYFGNKYIAFGLLAGCCLRWLIGVIAMQRQGYRHRMDFKVGSAIRRVILLAIPVFVGNYLNQIAIAVDKIMASGLPEGSVSALNYGVLVNNLFIALAGSMVSAYLYPRLSEAIAKGDSAVWRGQIRTGVAVLFIIGVPVTFGSLLYSRQAIELVYERGAFSAASSDLTAVCFFWFAVGLVFQLCIGFLNTAFFSRQDTKTPIVLAAIATCVNVAGNLLLTPLMGIGGIALSTSIAFFINMILLILLMRARSREATGGEGHLFGYPFAVKTVKIVAASLISVAVSYPVYLGLARITNAASGSSLLQLVCLLAAVLVCAAVYYILLRLLKVQEVHLIRKLLPGNTDPANTNLS